MRVAVVVGASRFNECLKPREQLKNLFTLLARAKSFRYPKNAFPPSRTQTSGTRIGEKGKRNKSRERNSIITCNFDKSERKTFSCLRCFVCFAFVRCCSSIPSAYISSYLPTAAAASSSSQRFWYVFFVFASSAKLDISSQTDFANSTDFFSLLVFTCEQVDVRHGDWVFSLSFRKLQRFLGDWCGRIVCEILFQTREGWNI